MRRAKSQICESIAEYVPREIGHLDNPQTAIPQIAKNEDLVRTIEAAVQQIPTSHELHQGDARAAVTGGAQMDGFIRLVRDILYDNGLRQAEIIHESRLELPGWYRAEKKWDLH